MDSDAYAGLDVLDARIGGRARVIAFGIATFTSAYLLAVGLFTSIEWAPVLIGAGTGGLAVFTTSLFLLWRRPVEQRRERLFLLCGLTSIAVGVLSLSVVLLPVMLVAAMPFAAPPLARLARSRM